MNAVLYVSRHASHGLLAIPRPHSRWYCAAGVAADLGPFWASDNFHLPPDAEVHLGSIPFDGSPAACVKALSHLAQQRHRWELWEEASRRLLPSLRAGRYRGPEALALLRVWARLSVGRGGEAVEPVWFPAGLDLLAEVMTALAHSGVDLSVRDMEETCRSCLRLHLPMPEPLLDVLARACGSRAGLAAHVLAALHGLSVRGHWAAAALPRELREGGLPPGALRQLLLHAAPYTPARRGTDAAVHTAVLRAAAQQLASLKEDIEPKYVLPGLPRYLSYLCLCASALLPKVMPRALMQLSLNGKARQQPPDGAHVLLDILDPGSRRELRSGPADGWDDRPKSSSLEKDVQRVLDALLRNRGEELELVGCTVAAQQPVGPVFIVDYVLTARVG
mmetsp:Transcript_74069/g.217340  ORF Transcript_74069/g.217340 Transcript_74069/m.217340 type:complete len:391 (-) Transcript_74069:67-1239(-)